MSRYSQASDRLFLVYLALLAWLPMPLGSNRPWSWALMETAVFLLAAVAMVLLAGGKIRLPRASRPLVIALTVLLGWQFYLLFQRLPLPLCVIEWLAPANAAWWRDMAPAVEASWGVLAADETAARSEGLKQLAYATFFLLTVLLVDSSRRLHRLIWLMVVVSLAQAVYGLLSYFLGDAMVLWQPDANSMRATGTYINPNNYAARLTLGIGLTIGLCLQYLAEHPRRPAHGGLLGLLDRIVSALLMILITALFFTRSRGAFVAISIAAGSLLLLGGLVRGRGAAERRALPLVILTAVVAGAWLASSGFLLRVLRYGFVDEWHQMLEGLFFDFAHNDHLQLLLEQGAVGFTLAFAFYLYCTAYMLKAYMHHGRSRRRQGLLLGILIATTSFILHGFVDFNFHIPANAAWFYTLLALGRASARRIEHRRWGQV